MGYFLLSLSLCLLVLSHACFAQLGPQQQQQSQWEALRGPPQHRLRGKTECRIERLTALEPNRRIKAEAGTTEIWDQNDEQFQCAGVAAFRHIIEPRGLHLPSYTNAPQIYYVIRGRGIQGTVIPGCPETYESVSQSGGQQQQQKVVDRHQKVRRIQEGDIIALPAGVAHWVFNDGETPLTYVALEDVANEANQLDLNIRKFYLAGNPQHGEEQQRQTRERKERERGQGEETGNIFSGFDEQFLAKVFNVNPETARKLQGENDNRGNIVRVEKEFRVLSPEFQEEEQERERERERERELNGGLSQSVCSLRLRENIAKPSRADVYTPRGGRISSINSHNLPVLDWIQLSAERGVLYRNAILAPLWNINAHAVVYILRGSGRIQIVGNAGKSVFNDKVQEGQLIIVPQNFAVVKKASEEGLEWISFKTHSNAMGSPLVGRTSALRGIPEDVLANAYDISREDARSLKFNREELAVFGPGSRSQRGEEEA